MRALVVTRRRGCFGALLLGSAAFFGLAPVSAASAEVATTVTVDVQPGTTLETYTPTSFAATVTPSSAIGSVVFTFDGAPIGNGSVSGGIAGYSTNTLKPGTWALRAQFIPAAGSGYAGSTSAPTTVLVNDIARIFVSDANGAAVPVGGQIMVGAKVTIAASGWPAGTDVNLAIGAMPLTTTIKTNASGSGSADITVPMSLPSAVYLLTAAGSKRSTSFVFYVYNPPKAVATPTPSSVATAPVGGGTTGGGASVITVTPAPVTVTPPPYTTTVAATPGTGDGLAGTGGNPAPLLAGAVLAIGLGASLMGTARPTVAGRHERRSSGRLRRRA